MHLVALAGLPGTGKSTLARALAGHLGAAVLDKDGVRAALFGDFVAYDREQDDLCVRALLAAARDLAGRGAPAVAVLDGRTFTRAASAEEVRRFAREAGLVLHWVECTCPAEVARARLERDARAGVHPARDRGPELHARILAGAQPLPPPKLVLDTHALTIEEQVAAVAARVTAGL